MCRHFVVTYICTYVRMYVCMGVFKILHILYIMIFLCIQYKHPSTNIAQKVTMHIIVIYILYVCYITSDISTREK